MEITPSLPISFLLYCAMPLPVGSTLKKGTLLRVSNFPYPPSRRHAALLHKIVKVLKAREIQNKDSMVYCAEIHTRQDYCLFADELDFIDKEDWVSIWTDGMVIINE